ncbi:cation diffusion facilitator family transporter [Pseudomonas sp. Irchel 3E13]|uniref:cation diffusion facilitator family transporter n=1 Tax=Pseudomonas sp. Irchel 3E13 TaxID=2008975 RepID=UPI000BA3AD99|nr:cation transporter [Pseudomonas sp. Irchel 3E13]
MGTRFFDLTSEQGVLRTSIVVTLFIAAIGIGFGLASGSFSIVFDGVYSMVDASMSGLSLVVVKLITAHTRTERMSRKLRERFTMGFWHLEPMVLALNGILLTGVALYALINAASSLLEGGRDLEFGVALVYAVVTVSACLAIAILEARANRKIRSDFVAMDVKGWVMSASITAALLIAFCFGLAVQGTRWEWLSPYIDPAVLALVCVVIIPMPISVVRQALADMFLVTPADLKQHVDEVAQAFVERHSMLSYRAYVAKVGRSREIELYFIVPRTMPARNIAEWDAWRDEIGNAIGGEGPDRWLTVVFTGDPEWAE